MLVFLVLFDGSWTVPPRERAVQSSLAGKAENLSSSFNSATY